MVLVQVIDEEICFKASVHSNIYELYHCRAQMHSNVYNHRSVQFRLHCCVLTVVPFSHANSWHRCISMQRRDLASIDPHPSKLFSVVWTCVRPHSPFSSHTSFHASFHCRKAKGVEHMLVDALLEADKALHFSDKIRSAREFITLDDSLLKAIENFSLYNPGCGCTLRRSTCACTSDMLAGCTACAQ